ncbi:MAG: glycosyltransferase family 4 protein [Microbacteriaceae bacterium]
MTRKRVYVVARSVVFGAGAGGLERAVADQIEGLVELGWQVSLVTSRSALRGEAPCEVMDVPWPSFGRAGSPGFGIAYVQWTRRVRRVLGQQPSAALLLHGGAAGVLTSADEDVRHHPVLVNPHGMEEFEPGGLLRWTNRVFTRRLVRRAAYAHKVIATDASLISRVQKNLSAPLERIVTIPNSVDIERLDALGSLDFEGQSADIVSVGRMNHNKGYDLLAVALGAIARELQGRPLVWRHYGKGPEADDVARRAADEPNLDFVQISGAPDAEVQAALHHARVFVQPSRYEGSSLTTLEAMTQGVVCVGTPVGGIPDKLTDGETGFLAASVSAEALQAAVRRALCADASIGRQARQRVIDDFSSTATVRKLAAELSIETGSSA